MLLSQNQNVWKLPAALNLTLGGLGAGFYLFALLVITPVGASWPEMLVQTAVIKLAGPLLVAIGLLSLTAEAGHPLNSIYLLTNLRHSWMSREALAAVIFILFAGLDWLIPSPLLRGVAALAAFAFILAQGMMVWRASGVFTWDVPVVPWFFLTCGLSTGGGMMLILYPFFNWTALASLPLVALFTAAGNGLAWIVYLRTPNELFQRDIAQIRQPGHVLLTIGVGHLLPILLIVISLLAGVPQLAPVAGLGLVFGGVLQKFAFAFQASALRVVMKS